VKPSFALSAELGRTEVPLSKQIAAQIVREIRRGRLGPGQALPSSRSLADTLGVHRNTVLHAFDDLIAQGYVETHPARGTFVTHALPQTRPSPEPKKRTRPTLNLPAFEASVPRQFAPGTLPLLGGLPDLREFPLAALQRAYRSALKQGQSLLDYGGGQGHPRLIASTLAYLQAKRGIVATFEELLITRGSQQALYLAARALLGEQTTIAVEAAGYPPAWEAFRLAGAQLKPISIDAEGLVVSELEKLVRRQRVAAVYVTPHHQYPTTVSLSGPRRLELLRLAERERFVIIEDDYDHEFHFSGHPLLPLAYDDEAGVVLHVGTFSKIFAPGVRLGYAMGRSEIIERMMRVRFAIDRQGDSVLELAVAILMEDGEFDAHVRRMFRLYGPRRELFYSQLTERFSDVLSIEEAKGGLAIWARVEEAISAQGWSAQAEREGVAVQAGSSFWFPKSPDVPYLRMGFSRLNEAEIVEALRRLRKALPAKRKAFSQRKA
jgi:GntR family transcriptional regulator / MocR family aminotransferase